MPRIPHPQPKPAQCMRRGMPPRQSLPSRSRGTSQAAAVLFRRPASHGGIESFPNDHSHVRHTGSHYRSSNAHDGSPRPRGNRRPGLQERTPHGRKRRPDPPGTRRLVSQGVSLSAFDTMSGYDYLSFTRSPSHPHEPSRLGSSSSNPSTRRPGHRRKPACEQTPNPRSSSSKLSFRASKPCLASQTI